MYFVHTPGLKVIYPSTPYDAKGLLKAAVRDNNPVLFFEHKYLYRRIKEEIPAGDYTVPIGKAAVRREGKHLTILSYAAMMHNSLEAADALAKENIEAEVIDLRTLLPLDEDTILNSVKKTNRVLVVHEDTKTGGIAGEIAAILCEKAFGDLDGPDFPRDGARYTGALLAASGAAFSAEHAKGNCLQAYRIGTRLFGF